MGFTVVLQASRTCNQMKACLNLLLQFSIVWIIDELHCRWKDLHLMLIHGFNQGQVATQRLTIKYVLATLRPQADCASMQYAEKAKFSSIAYILKEAMSSLPKVFASKLELYSNHHCWFLEASEPDI
ncbi:uncharacterized protein LOC112496119 isoform X2 [Citrus sinensis]|uniref:uncharacterized protein LOC112496119 isoform X2 n=1 Tax=Citrus sinensis TaxID=2711 RepID=UPI002277BC76|nr:uncharacterized protein LOC112496119 isoform X2 [Citrus sinensis]